MVLIRAIGFRCVVDDLDRKERLFARQGAAPQRTEGFVLIKPNATGIAQMGGDAVRLFAGSVALDHDPPQIRARHALDRLDRDPLRLFNQPLPHFGSVPMPPGPA